jgi:probable rRNA maturation factor
MLVTETEVASPQWPAADWEALAAEAVTAAMRETPRLQVSEAGFSLEVSVRLSDDAEVHQLNNQYRGKDKPTNVLSFPMLDPGDLDALANTDDGEVLLGDIILAAETCAAEAEAKGWTTPAYAQHLIVHGVLHLLGYDHELGETEASEMEELERRACRALGLRDPYEG